MSYLIDNYYISHGLNLGKAVDVTACFLAKSCSSYKATIIAPKKGILSNKRDGRLPDSLPKKKKTIMCLLAWIRESSEHPYLFSLELYTKTGKCAFAFYDSGDVWQLDIDDSDFRKLQKELLHNKLPEDLFYPEHKTVRILKEGIFTKLLRALGFQVEACSIYSPKEWEEKNREATKKK
ncbi:hypothetical protein KY363_00755 [Candidatus Woesearchaeota archaeon]|nr:hypothetical protein [Candidatus Woesearchaeota archaeon]